MSDVLQADRELDCQGMLCPLPVINLSKAMRTLQLGQVVKLIATDKGAPADMQAYSRNTGNELIDFHQEGDQFIFFFRKKK
jgi:tRNA 2-thiouridine synthesizing protein A